MKNKYGNQITKTKLESNVENEFAREGNSPFLRSWRDGRAMRRQVYVQASRNLTKENDNVSIRESNELRKQKALLDILHSYDLGIPTMKYFLKETSD